MAHQIQQNVCDKHTCELCKLMAIQPHLQPHFSLSAVYFATKKHLLPFVECLLTSHNTVTYYLLSHCHFEHPVHLGTSSAAKRCLHRQSTPTEPQYLPNLKSTDSRRHFMVFSHSEIFHLTCTYQLYLRVQHFLSFYQVINDNL